MNICPTLWHAPQKCLLNQPEQVHGEFTQYKYRSSISSWVLRPEYISSEQLVLQVNVLIQQNINLINSFKNYISAALRSFNVEETKILTLFIHHSTKFQSKSLHLSYCTCTHYTLSSIRITLNSWLWKE